METNDGKKGGVISGPSHKDGGVAAVIVETGQPIEVEGNEAIITKKAVEKHHELLSAINQSEGGVPILDPNEIYEKGGNINDLHAKWSNLVNMSASELQRFYDSDEGKEAGLTEKEAKEEGIKSGRESARWIIKMKNTPKSEWTPTMEEWANRQISFISGMRGVDGPLYDSNNNKTRKHLALLIWGHNPEKANKAEHGMVIEQAQPAEQTKEISQYHKITHMENPIKIGTVVVNNEASNDEKEWIILGIGEGNIVLSHSPKFAHPKSNLELSFDRFVQLFNDHIMSIPAIDALGLENFEAKKMMVEMAVLKLKMDEQMIEMNKRIEEALEDTKRARAELFGLTDETQQMGDGGTVYKPLRGVRVTYENGDVIETSMASHLTDEDIRNYFKVGRTFNIGSGGKDLMSKVKSVDILMAKGGTIPNNYEGKTAEEVWNAWSTTQKQHFLSDHSEEITIKDDSLKVDMWHSNLYAELPGAIKNVLDKHVKEGQYEEGGNLKVTVNNISPINEAQVVLDKQQALSALKTLLPTLKGAEKQECQAKIKELETQADKPETAAERLLEKLKADGKLKRYFDVRGNGKKMFETIVPNKKESGFWKRYESLTKGNIGLLQNEMLDESDLLSYFKKTANKNN